jgi:hypothetical protein
MLRHVMVEAITAHASRQRAELMVAAHKKHAGWVEGLERKEQHDDLELVRAARPTVNPNIGFACALLQWGASIEAPPQTTQAWALGTARRSATGPSSASSARLGACRLRATASRVRASKPSRQVLTRASSACVYAPIASAHPRGSRAHSSSRRAVSRGWQSFSSLLCRGDGRTGAPSPASAAPLLRTHLVLSGTPTLRALAWVLDGTLELYGALSSTLVPRPDARVALCVPRATDMLWQRAPAAPLLSLYTCFYYFAFAVHAVISISIFVYLFLVLRS